MKYLPWFLLLVLGVLVWLLWPSAKVDPSTTHVDTVYVDKPMPILRIDTVDRAVPFRVNVYLPDTAARRQAEKGDILTGVEIANNLLTISKLTPTGLGIKTEYRLPEIPDIRIDGQGNTDIGIDKKARRRKRWEKIGNTAAIAAAAVVGFMIGSK